MNDTDPFEDRLRRARFRPAPQGWRDEILAKAAAIAESKPPLRRRGGHDFRAWLRSPWFGALAAAWCVILALRWSTPGPGRPTAGPGRADDWNAVRHQQRRLLSGLEEELGTPPRAPGRATVQEPRSDLGQPFLGGRPRTTPKLSEIQPLTDTSYEI